MHHMTPLMLIISMTSIEPVLFKDPCFYKVHPFL